VENKRIISKRPSIQGQWNPFYSFDGESQPITQFKPVGAKYPRPKYNVARRKVTDFSPRSIPADEFKKQTGLKKAFIVSRRNAKWTREENSL